MKMVFNPSEVPEGMDEEAEQDISGKATDYTNLTSNVLKELDQIQLKD